MVNGRSPLARDGSKCPQYLVTVPLLVPPSPKEGSLLETNRTIVFAHSFGGLRFLLHSLATGFSLASNSAFARKVSCTAQCRRSLRRAFGLLLISKIPPPTSSSRYSHYNSFAFSYSLDRSQCLRFLTNVSSVLCPPLLPGQTVVSSTRATCVHVYRE